MKENSHSTNLTFESSMLQKGHYTNIYRVIFLIILRILLCEPKVAMSKKEGQRNETCEITYQSSRTDMVTFYLYFENKTNLNMSHKLFQLMTCESAENCEFGAKCKVYKKDNISNSVECRKEVDLSYEIKKTNALSYDIFEEKTKIFPFGKIRNLKCKCKKYDLKLKLDTTFPQLGIADVNIKYPKHDKPKLKDISLLSSPNDNLIIKNKNKIMNHFQVSALDLCRTYKLTVKVKSLPTCTNWKTKSRLTFPIESVLANTFSCQYNYTTTTINTFAEIDKRIYYTLIFEKERIRINITKELAFPTKQMEAKSKGNMTGFFKTCARGCNRCGKERRFFCYYKISKSLKNGKTSVKNTIIILCILGGLIFLGILGMILWFKYNKRSKSCNSHKDEIHPRHTTRSFTKMVIPKVDDYPGEYDPIYEEIKDYHHYDKPDIGFKDADSAE